MGRVRGRLVALAIALLLLAACRPVSGTPASGAAGSTTTVGAPPTAVPARSSPTAVAPVSLPATVSALPAASPSPAARPTSATTSVAPVQTVASPPASAPTPVGAPLTLNAVAFPDVRHGWAAGDGVILATSDGGQHWGRQYTGAETIAQLVFVSATAGWAVGTHALLHTADGGQHWRPVEEPAQPLQQVDFLTANTGWGIGGDALYATTDAGASWQARPTPVPVGGVCFTDPQHGWVVNAAPTSAHPTPTAIYGTIDGGRTWEKLSVPPGVSGSTGFVPGGGWWQTLRCVAPDTLWDLVAFDGYARGEGYELYRSPDGGRHWAAVAQNMGPVTGVPLGPGASPGPLVAIDALTAYLVGWCGGCNGYGTTDIGATDDGGRSWHNVQVLPYPAVRSAISFPNKQQGWLATQQRTGDTGGYGVVLAAVDGGETWAQQYPAGP